MDLTEQLHKDGFIHVTDALTTQSIEKLHEHFRSIDFDDIRRKINGKDRLDGHNPFINNSGRTVIQVYQYDRLHDDNICIGAHEREYNLQNKDAIERSVSDSQHLESLLKDYRLDHAKLFFNHPGCDTQEIHCDFADDFGVRDFLYMLIPLNNCNDNMGTTVFYYSYKVLDYLLAANPFLLPICINEEVQTIIEDVNSSCDLNQVFSDSTYKKSFKIGEALLFLGDTYHQGTSNHSKDIRKFLYTGWTKRN